MGTSSIIAGKYRLLRKLGSGSMGSVWCAEHLTLGSPVAIKVIEGEIAPEAVARFLREAQSAAALRSPHVVQILDHGVDHGTPYIAMELLEGESLGDRLGRLRVLSPIETARVLMHVARAAGRAHDAGIIHRDLKPDNIFIVRNDDEELAKVLDFGIAKSGVRGLDGPVTGATRAGALLGTPYYMSPEQAEGSITLDHRADIWALGVIAFECLLGRRPFEAETLSGQLLAITTRPIPVPSQWGAVPAGFDAWFARACARDVNQRFFSARDAAGELKRLCESTAPLTANLSATQAVPGLAGSGPNRLSGSDSSQPITAQSAAGLSSSTSGTRGVGSGKLTVPIALSLVVSALLAGAIALAWSHFAARHTSVAAETASVAPPVASAAPPSVSLGSDLQGAAKPAPDLVVPQPAESAQPKLAASATSERVPPTPAASGSLVPATRPMDRPSRPAPHATTSTATVSSRRASPVPATPKPTTAPPAAPANPGAGKINLGI